MQNIEQLLSRLERVKPNGNGKYLACCPAHNDKSPSLGIKQDDNGKILIHCFSGCAVTDIVSAVGMQLSDLMPDNPTYKKRSKPPRFNKYELFDRLVFETIILSLAIRQLLNGEPLEEQDLYRVLQAEDVINNIVREVRQ